MIPDAEKVIGDYLRSNLAIEALEARVVGETPKSLTRPWVRITLLADPPVNNDPADHLISAFVQLDCYAGSTGGQEEAARLRLAVREALSVMHWSAHTNTVVTGAIVTSTSRQPDTDIEPARQRYVMSATVFMHST